MSLANFQIAVAALLRRPDPYRDPDWLRPATDDLTAAERASLADLAAQGEFNKYGRDQLEQRWIATWRKLPRSRQLLGEERLRRIWITEFEPAHATTVSDVSSMAAIYTLAFLDHLQANLPGDLPAFASDLLAFEKAEIELAQCALRAHPVREDAVLAHGAFRVLELTHCLTDWLVATRQVAPDAPLPEPERQPEILLLVRKAVGRIPRIFAIDAAMRDFLWGQIGRAPFVEAGATTLNDLRTMGLTRRD